MRLLSVEDVHETAQLQAYHIEILNRVGSGRIAHDVDESILLGDRVYVMTARPGRIKEVVKVELPRPRHVDLLTSEAFMTLKRRIMHSIHEEAVLSFTADEARRG